MSVRPFSLEPSAKATPSPCEFSSMQSCFRLLIWLHSAGKVAVCGGEQPGGCICWLAVGALQCGELWVKEEVARLLQAKLRPGTEPILLPHICHSSACAQPVLKGTKKWYHCSLLTRSDGCKSILYLYYCVASFFLGRLNTHFCSPHIGNP